MTEPQAAGFSASVILSPWPGRFKITYWDAAILVAAESLGADLVYSEDLKNRQVYGRVRVINPFV